MVARWLGLGLASGIAASTWVAQAESPSATEQGETPSVGAESSGPGAALLPAQVPPAELSASLEGVPRRMDSVSDLATATDATTAPPVQRVMLIHPVAPPTPPQPTRFAAPPSDPAGQAARAIAQRVARFRSYRSEIPDATWRVDESAVFRVRTDAECKQALRRTGVHAHVVERELFTPVPSPVALDGPVAGVTFSSMHADREVEMACELAVRLPAIVEILKRHGVRAVGVMSSYREEPRTSFHTFGLALDLAAFRTHDGALVVSKHFEPSPGQETCNGQPSTQEGKALLAIACDLATSNLLSSVLTPNYNEGHRDHFHLDIRPDDPRVFLR